MEPARLSLVGLLALGALAGCDDCSKSRGDAAPDATAAGPDAAASDVTDAAPVSATPVPAASVAAMVNPENLPAYSGPTGSVEGRVYVVGDPPAPIEADYRRCPDARNDWGTSFRFGEGPAPEDAGAGARPLADAVVAVTGYKGFYVPERREEELVTIEGCAFSTRTVTMTFGQRLEVKNLTTEFWTPLLEPGSKLVMMVAPPKGDPVRLYPKQPGHYLLVDRDRKWAVADLYAFLHPLHDATDRRGHYRIDGVPVGKVTVNTTHPRFKAEASAPLEVQANVVHQVDLVLRHVAEDAGAPAAPDAGYHPPLR